MVHLFSMNRAIFFTERLISALSVHCYKTDFYYSAHTPHCKKKEPLLWIFQPAPNSYWTSFCMFSIDLPFIGISFTSLLLSHSKTITTYENLILLTCKGNSMNKIFQQAQLRDNNFVSNSHKSWMLGVFDRITSDNIPQPTLLWRNKENYS